MYNCTYLSFAIFKTNVDLFECIKHVKFQEIISYICFVFSHKMDNKNIIYVATVFLFLS